METNAALEGFSGFMPGGGTQVDHVVIREQKNTGKGTFLCIIAVRADRG